MLLIASYSSSNNSSVNTPLYKKTVLSVVAKLSIKYVKSGTYLPAYLPISVYEIISV